MSVNWREHCRIIKDSKKLSHTLNKYSTNLTKTLKLKKISPALKNKSLKHLLKQFKNQSIKKIQKHFNSNEKFCFREFQQDKMIKMIKELAKNKDSTFTNIPVKIMVSSVDIYSQILMKIFNDCVKRGNFHDILKFADITLGLVFKKGNKN